MASTPPFMSDSDTSSAHSSSPPHPVTPASGRHSGGGAGNFLTTPAMGYSCTIHEHPQSLFDAQTADLDLTPHEKKAVPYLRAKTARSLHHPTEDLLSPPQLLEQQEPTRYLRFQEDTTEEEDKFYFQSQEGHPSTIHKHPQSPYDIQTSALNHPQREKKAITKLTARGASSLPYPIKDRPSPQQLLEQQEAKWHQIFQDCTKEFMERYRLRSLESQAELYRRSDEWYERWEKSYQRIIEQSVEIEHLIVESSPPIFLVFLTDSYIGRGSIRKNRKYEIEGKFQCQRRLGIHGALRKTHQEDWNRLPPWDSGRAQ
ncbi:hypothetical protein B9Z19DRAFT_370729 [Tuber borchii]|uniref:Uncharacterized protein n=1 Tax=Tuber borchii TaxID=42251 RepID=A0A2T7A4H0_TUBBO|nr:hypothetical protein B9Z19DRAFT_370729 [Tuber borchii]